jgi:hypothetical protein
VNALSAILLAELLELAGGGAVATSNGADAVPLECIAQVGQKKSRTARYPLAGTRDGKVRGSRRQPL